MRECFGGGPGVSALVARRRAGRGPRSRIFTSSDGAYSKRNGESRREVVLEAGRFAGVETFGHGGAGGGGAGNLRHATTSKSREPGRVRGGRGGRGSGTRSEERRVGKS